VPLLTVTGGCSCCLTAFTCGAIIDDVDDDDNNDLLPRLPTGVAVIAVAVVATSFDREKVLLFVVAADFVVCEGDICVDGVDDDDTADVGGVAENEGGFTVFAIPHSCDSVVLTTLRPGLLGSHIFALSSGDTVAVLCELPAGSDDDDNCCAYTKTTAAVLARIAARGIPKVRSKLTNNVVRFILNYLDITIIYMK
jgi:hypothetical protein